MSISMLELPYIFGSMPGKAPLWKPLIRYILSPFPLFYPAGGTTCVSVQPGGAGNLRGSGEGATR